MAAFINTNISSLNAQRNLNSSQGALQTSLQRLSSGLRINSAKDDAAGLAIASRFTTQIKGTDQAVRNANDGISLAQTGEGALAEVTNNLQRIRELAVQSANSTNSSDDRAAIDLEVQQRLSEIDRTASQTAFNGQKILDGSFGSAGFQIGANAGETIAVGLSTSVRISGMGAASSVTSGVALSTLMNSTTTAAAAASYTTDVSAAFADYSTVAATAAKYTTDTVGAGTAAQTFDITVGSGSAFTVTLAGNTTNATDLAAEIQGAAGYASADFTVVENGGKLEFTAKTAGAGNISFGGTDAALVTAGSVVDTAGTAADTSANKTFTLQGPGGTAMTVTLNSNITSTADLVSAITGSAGYAGSGITAADGGSGNLVLTASTAGAGNVTVGGADASLITTGVGTGDVAGTAATSAASLTLGAGDLSIQIGTNTAVDITGTFSSSADLVDAINSSVQGVYATVDNAGKLNLTSSQDITLSGTNAGASATELAFATTTNAATGNLSSANVKTVAGANDIIQRVDNALSTVSTLRSTFGAVQNRFESVIANLSSTSENLAAARSRIQDADFAAETATLTRGQILQQAGTAMLAQANSLPNGVLALLRG